MQKIVGVRMARRSLVPRMAALIGVLLVALGLAVPAGAQTGENVLVVVNRHSPDSIRIGTYYLAARNIPDHQMLRLDVTVADEIPRAVYASQIEVPIARWLRTRGAQDRILYIVLTKGVPLRIAGTLGRNGTLASVDSDLTLLYRKMTGERVASGGRVDNPYYEPGPDGASTDARFSHVEQDIYLVTRLDGFSADDVIALIDRGLSASTDGRIVLDQRADVGSPADRWLAEAAEALVDLSPDRAILETTTRAATTTGRILGYYSWGSNDPALQRRDLGLDFAPGAIASSYVGTSARTFTAPPEDWTIGTWQDSRTFHASSPEWLVGDLVKAGVTGVVGHVADPYLDGSLRPAPLFTSYLSGYNLAESVYRALPHLGWRAVVVGDPLVAPFERAPLSADAATPAADDATGLPRYFAARRVAQLVEAGTDPAVVPLLIQADLRRDAGDLEAARDLLEQASSRGDLPLAAELSLAETYGTLGDGDRAEARYRSLLERSPNEVAALNNLAYIIKDRPPELDEALRLAQRAFVVSEGNPTVADTVGWIHHLLGNDEEALRYLHLAATGAPTNAEIRLHAAVVLEALGQIEAARTELAEAVRLDPRLDDTPEAKSLRQGLEPQADGR